MNREQLARRFAQNQADLSLDNIKVQWMGESVLLYKGNENLTSLSSRLPYIVERIMAYCVKNTYRCSQIQNGRIML